VGLTRYRAGLYPLEPFTKEDAEIVVKQVEALQEDFLKTLGSRFVYVSDEFYLLAELPMPPSEAYEDFPQIENGVGMEASFEEEFIEALKAGYPMQYTDKTMIATGVLAKPFIEKLVHRAKEQYPDLQVEVTAIQNELFGGGVTVAGLIGGKDLIHQLTGKTFDRLMIPSSMLKADEPIFLDDVTVSDVEEALQTTLVANENDGFAFLQSLLGCEGCFDDSL